MKKIWHKFHLTFKEDRVIPFLFNFFLFLLPLVFLPWTSELFEFNKIVFVYMMTIMILSFWVAKMVVSKKFIFTRTILDLPLILFLLSQLASTVFSIDKYTSIFGYYSRFNGGLISSVCYVLLYWAFVTNMSVAHTKNLFKTILASLAIVSVWGALEHFGLSFSCVILRNQWDANCWVQDVQARVFATMGQPNWLASYLVAISPLVWAMALNAKNKIKKLTLKNYWVYHLLSLLFFATLLFTKSRSGIIAFVATYIIFWLMSWNWKVFVVSTASLLLAVILIGTPWTPNLSEVINPQKEEKAEIVSQAGTVIELDGTESGQLRQIVWQGAFDVWRAYPVFGTGVETFAFSYYMFRPTDHNLTSEWDFLYNKAHNELLNIAANNGTLGLISYLVIIAFFLIWIILKTPKGNYKAALVAGFIGLGITNFFGFSVVGTSVLFFLIPAMALALSIKRKITKPQELNINSHQKTKLIVLSLGSLALLFMISRYWYADVLFARGKSQMAQGQLDQAINSFQSSVTISPFVATYWDQMAQSYAQKAILEENEENSLKLAEMAKSYSDKALSLSPRNINLAKSRSNLFVDLAQVSPEYLLESITTLQRLMSFAPTDPAVYQMMGLSFAQAGYPDQAELFIKQAIELKPDYKRARLTLNYIYQQSGKFDKAREQLQYVLDNISPDDTSVRQQLEDLKNLESKN